MAQDLTLSIDVGTGSVRTAVVDGRGRIRFIAAREHEQIVPAYGWSEQRPEDWWAGVVATLAQALEHLGRDVSRVAAICACGQMHGTVLLDDAGGLASPVTPLWNDKRTQGLVDAFAAGNAPETYLPHTANPPTPAWPGFKLQWFRDNRPEAYGRAATVLMPKDYVNYRLTGEIAQDTGDASCSFLMDPETGAWSPEMADRLGLDLSKLPPIRAPQEILGHVHARAARETGLPEGLPVLVGGADYPTALLGSGVCRPGIGSDVTGTSCIITLNARKPLLDPEISNVATAEGNWGAFVLLESGGDAMRWARRAFHENRASYEDFVAKAGEAPAGSHGLFFLPYLVGERLGEHRNSRAQFFGINAGHGLAHLQRAVMEGVALAVNRHVSIMETAANQRLDRVVASGGGAKTRLWLEIKASVYNKPILVPAEAECGVVGCAALAAHATGRFNSLEAAVDAFVSYSHEVVPNPEWAERYARMQPLFDRLYTHSRAFYDDLDTLQS